MSVRRADRVGDELKRLLGNLIRSEIKDPQLPEIVSVTQVEMSRDLSYAKIYISIFGEKEDKDAGMAALKRATGYLRRQIGRQMRLRLVPELSFVLDDSVEQGMKMDRLIDQVLAQDAEKRPPAEPAQPDAKQYDD